MMLIEVEKFFKVVQGIIEYVVIGGMLMEILQGKKMINIYFYLLFFD